MPLLETVARIYQSEDLDAALSTVLADLAPRGLRRVARISAAGELVRSWPGEARPAADLGALARSAGEEASGPAVVGDGALAFGVGDAGETVVLEGEPRLFPADPHATPALDEWRPLVSALDAVARRQARLEALVEERDELRRRAEESEALHTLGLAANRSLDPDEVLNLVARFTRSLLGAHYVTVTTYFDGEASTAAAVGVRGSDLALADDFAAEVIREGRPMVVPSDDDAEWERRFPVHAAEGMRTGLGVPLALFGRTFGALVIGYRRLHQLAPRDTQLALTLAGHAAVAINNARLHRTIENRSRELERAYEELRWSSQAKERFFATMSHELRTPLNAILGYQSLILEGVAGEVPEGILSLINHAHRATRSLLFLVNDVLDLAKIEAGKLELDFRRIQLHPVLQESLSTIHPLAEAKGLRLVAPPEQTLPSIRTDAERVRQILLNLLSNAVKFTDDGEVRLEARLRHVVPEDGAEAGAHSQEWVEIAVADTGPGIPAADQERIFHEFEQVGGPDGRGGTGLGLPISRKLARLLHGELVVQSAPGSGSTFVLRLPVEHPEAQDGQVAGSGKTS